MSAATLWLAQDAGRCADWYYRTAEFPRKANCHTIPTPAAIVISDLIDLLRHCSISFDRCSCKPLDAWYILHGTTLEHPYSLYYITSYSALQSHIMSIPQKYQLIFTINVKQWILFLAFHHHGINRSNGKALADAASTLVGCMWQSSATYCTYWLPGKYGRHKTNTGAQALISQIVSSPVQTEHIRRILRNTARIFDMADADGASCRMGSAIPWWLYRTLHWASSKCTWRVFLVAPAPHLSSLPWRASGTATYA